MGIDTYSYPLPWVARDTTHPTRLAVVLWAHQRIGVYEEPAGSNRSPLIDSWLADAGSPLGSPWCMAFARMAWKAAGVAVLGGASCQQWHAVAPKAARWVATPGIGDIVLYDFGTQQGWADHAGIVIRIDPLLVVEGNTADDGGREGVGVFMHDRHAAGRLILGCVSLEG